MSTFRTRGRLALAAILAAAALGSAAPAQADARPLDCDAKLEQLETRFHEVAEKKGWEYAATEWWPKRWERYWERCLAPEVA